MLAKVFSCAVVGVDGVLVEVEVDVGNGQPGIVIVGLPDTAVQESQERVRAGDPEQRRRGFLTAKGHDQSAPADLKKAGPDLRSPDRARPSLLASGQVAADLGDMHSLVGELSLDGIVAAYAGHSSR